MTTVEILFRYATPPTETITLALAATKDVYGIRRSALIARPARCALSSTPLA